MGAGSWYNKASPKDFILRTGGLLLFLLLVPALNLTGVAQTTIQQRQEEIGIRKSFGATGTNILRQLIAENLIISLLGGIIGMLLSLPAYVDKKFFIRKRSYAYRRNDPAASLFYNRFYFYCIT